MIDFLDTYYFNQSFDSDGEDMENAKRKAFSTVLPYIMKNELTQRQSLCLRYKYVNHMSQNEIADILKLSQPTVSRHINAAKDIVNNNLRYCYLALATGLNEYDKTYQ